MGKTNKITLNIQDGIYLKNSKYGILKSNEPWIFGTMQIQGKLFDGSDINDKENCPTIKIGEFYTF